MQNHALFHRRFAPLLTLLLLWAAPLLAEEPEGVGIELMDGPPQIQVDRDHVVATLFADRPQLSPGDTVRVALRLEMDEEWYIYWKRPAASTTAEPSTTGLPTVVAFSAPEGYTLHMAPWPVSTRLAKQLPKEPLTDVFLYKRSVLFDAWIKVPETAPTGQTVNLGVQASWLICHVQCKMDKIKLELPLPIVAIEEAEAPPQSWSAIFRANDQRKPLEALPGYTVSSSLSQQPVRPGDHFAAIFIVTPSAGTTLREPAAAERIAAMLEPMTGIELLGRPSTEMLEGGALKIIVPLQGLADLQPDTTVALHGVLQGDAHQGSTVTPVNLIAQMEIPTAAANAAVSILDSSVLAEEEPTESGSTLPLWQALLFALLGGLILNIMPCVLPVLSLKSLALVELANETQQRVRNHVLMYALGVVASFWVLAAVIVGLQWSGQLVGWGFQFQDPRFVVLMTVIVFVAALGLFGVFPIPGFSLDIEGGKKAGLHTSFVHGIMATLLSTPCSAPLLGTALAFALSQPPLTIFAIMTLVGIGLALPVIMLAVFPSFQRIIPRPGMWMDTFKQAIAFLMVGTTLWLFYVLSHQISGQALVSVMGLLMAVSIAAWVMGHFSDPFGTLRRKVIVTVSSVLIAVSGLWWLSLEDSSAPMSMESEWIEWRPFEGEKTMELSRQGHTVFIDFTASWCMSCKAFEAAVIETPEVADLLRRNKVIAVKADWSKKDEETGRWIEHFGARAIPLYVVLPAGQPNRPHIMADSITQGQLLRALELSGPSTATACANGQPTC